MDSFFCIEFIGMATVDILAVVKEENLSFRNALRDYFCIATNQCYLIRCTMLKHPVHSLDPSFALYSLPSCKSVLIYGIFVYIL